MNTLKSVRFGLAALSVILTLSGCGGGSQSALSSSTPAAGAENGGAAVNEELQPEKGAKLLVWNDGPSKQIIELAGKAFQEKYGVPVEFQEVGPDKTVEKMITDGPAGVGADVFIAVHDRVGSAVNAGIVLPNDVFEEETKKNSYPTAIDAATVTDSKTKKAMLFGFPVSVETTAVFYNKDLIPQAPKTWDDVKSFARTFNDPKSNKWAYMWEAGNGYWSYGFFAGYGAYVFGKNGTDPADIGLNNEGGIEAAKFMQSLKKDVLSLSTTDVTSDIKKSLFTSGKLAMNVSGPWDVQSLKKDVKNLGVAPYPNLPNGKPMKPFSGVKVYMVNANSKFPNAAKLFAHMVTDEEWQMKNFELYGNLPANKKLADSDKIKNDPFSAAFLGQFENSVPMPSIPEMNAYWNTQESALGAIWNEGKDPKQSMDDWVAKIKETINGSK